MGLSLDIRCRPMTRLSVLRKRDNRLISLISFGVVCDGLPALGMMTIRVLAHSCGRLPSVRDLFMIFQSQFVEMSPACWICADIISSWPVDL